MRVRSFFVAVSSVLVLGGSVLFSSAPASAYVACNHDGDCWHTATKVDWAGVILSFHDDSWWDAHKGDGQYHWHDEDADHQWQHGYWTKGNWHHE